MKTERCPTCGRTWPEWRFIGRGYSHPDLLKLAAIAVGDDDVMVDVQPDGTGTLYYQGSKERGPLFEAYNNLRKALA